MLIEKIQQLKKERRAILLAHNYQPDDIQAIADFNGDSLELARKSAEIDAEVVVFCGVHFMAETSAILNPHKKILLPDSTAGCPMADMVTAETLRAEKLKHPGAKVVCYVNSTAEVKAESDICCTSANAVAVVRSLGGAPVLFVPDKNLGQWVGEQLNRELILWPGYCPTHQCIRARDVAAARAAHPAAEVLVHPECPKDVRELATHCLSTGQMCRHARASGANEFIIVTEAGIFYRLKNENPGKQFHAVGKGAWCANMKKCTLEKILWCLEDLAPEVRVDEKIAIPAKRAIDAMLAV